MGSGRRVARSLSRRRRKNYRHCSSGRAAPFAKTKGRTRPGAARRDVAALNSKFGTNNAGPCFVSPWEINASASRGLIAPCTPNSNNIYLRRGAPRRSAAHCSAAQRSTAWPPRVSLLGSGKCDWFRRMCVCVCVRARGRIVSRDTQKAATFRRSIGSPLRRATASFIFIYSPLKHGYARSTERSVHYG